MKKGNTQDLNIYSSDSMTTDVTIGEWKAYRKEHLNTVDGRLCTYADLVCDYIKMVREVMQSMGIEMLPHSASSAIDAIVVRQGRECVPYSTASNPVALDVYLSNDTEAGVFIGFSFSGKYGQFPSIMCDEIYDGTVTVHYDYNTIVAYASVDLDKDSENINKTLCVELNNFDLVPFIATNTATAYKNAGHSWDETLNINGNISFDKVVSTEISSQRKLYFKIAGGTSSQYPNPDPDQKYQYNLFSIIKFGGFSCNKVPGYYHGLVYGTGVTQYYNGILTQYKKEYDSYHFVKDGDYDYGGRLTLSYTNYYGVTQEYDLWGHFTDEISSTMCPPSGYFEPAMLDDGVATITVTGVKNHSVRVLLQTDGKVIIRNISNMNIPSAGEYDLVKKYGKPVVLISDMFGIADSDISNPGMVKLAVLPAEKPEPEGKGDYDRYMVALSVNGSEPQEQDWKTFKFATDGYVLDVNWKFLGSPTTPLKATDTYKLLFRTIHKYVPKIITFRVAKELLYEITDFTVNGTVIGKDDIKESEMYIDYKYATKEGDPDNKVTVTTGYFYRPDQGSADWEIWEKFFETTSETGAKKPSEYQMIRISLNNGRYNKNASFIFYPTQSKSPTYTQYVQFQNLTFVNGETDESASPFPRNTTLYIRTLGRITLNVRLFPLYEYRDAYYNNRRASGEYDDFETYITSEEITTGFKFWMTRHNGGNNTIIPRVNYVGLNSDTYDSNVIVIPSSSVKCEIGIEQEIVLQNIDIMRLSIFLILQEIQTSLLTVNIPINENLQYVKSDYTITDIPTENQSPAVYIGLEHYSSGESSLLGIAKIINRETPYTVYPSKDGRAYSGGNYTYQFDIATTKWKFAFEWLTDALKNNFQRTTLIKSVKISGDINATETDTDIVMSDNKFNPKGQSQYYKVSNKNGLDNITITMTPTRWNVAVIEMSISKLALEYNPELGKCWLQPSLINPYGQTFDSAITWTSQTKDGPDTCWFYVPEYNDFVGSDLFPANASGEHRRVWINFTPSYMDGNVIKPIPQNAQTTLIGYNAIFIDNAGSSSSQSVNLGNIESTQFDSHQFDEVQTRLGKTQHDAHSSEYKFKIELTPIEGEPHMILVGVEINIDNYKIKYPSSTFDTNPPVIPQTKNTTMDFYLYCPYIQSGIETGRFTGGIPYNNVFTHTEGIISSTPDVWEGQPYTHIFRFRNNIQKDFWELNEQYPSNGVGTTDDTYKYKFTVQLTVLAGPTYTQGVDCVTATIGNNMLESDKLSIMPDIGEKMTVNAWTWIWVSTDTSNPQNVEKQKKVAADQSSTQPWFHYEFVGASSEIKPSDVFNITGGPDTDGVYTFTVKSKPSQSYMQMRLQLQYQETVSYIENKQIDITLATKMMPYKVEAYNGYALNEDYKYIYTLKRDGTVGVIYVYLNCPQIEVDGGEIIVTSPGFIGSTIDRAISPFYNRIIRFTNNLDYYKVNPSSFSPSTDPYENREVTLEIEYRSNDIPEYPKLSYTYNVGAFGRTQYDTFEITGDETASANPGSSFHVTVQRKTYISTGYKELVQEEGDFPFIVEFSIKEEGYNFDDYFTVSFNPQLGNKSHTITVKEDAQILVPFTIQTKPKMVSNDFPWIKTPTFNTQIDVKLYINLFTNQDDLSDALFFLTPYEYNIYIKNDEGLNIFRLWDRTIGSTKYYFASFMVKKENGVVKLYYMTSATEYIPVYMSVGYSDPISAQSGQTSWGYITDSSDYTNVEQHYDAIVNDYITIIKNKPEQVTTYQDVYAYPLGFQPTSTTIKSKVQVNWGLVQDFQIGPTALSTDTFWNYYSQTQVDAELG